MSDQASHLTIHGVARRPAVASWSMLDHRFVHFDGVRAALATGAILATIGTSRFAHAEVRVERSADADSCPDAQSFLQRMREGGDEPEIGAKTTDITVRFERTRDGYRSLVRVAGGEPRSLVDAAPQCDGLAEATALAVKLALDLEAARPPAAVIAPAPVVSLDEPAPAPPIAARRARSLGELSLSGVVAFGLVSPVASGVRAGASIVLDSDERWTLGLSGLVLSAQSTNIGGGTVEQSMQGGGVEGCGRARVGRSVLLAMCGRVEALRFAGESRGFERTDQQARASVAGSLLARARTRVAGPIAVFVELGAIAPFVRQRFAIDTVGVVYDAPPVAGAGGIGTAIDFE